MKNTLISVTTLGLALILAGCMRGQSTAHEYDSDQVRTTKDANGETEYHLILPIKGRPFVSGAQLIFDQLVKSQAGGEIQSITVDPSGVEVPFSRVSVGEGMFMMIGKAHVTLSKGKGEFDAYFAEKVDGGCQGDRIFSVFGPYYMPEENAYREGLGTWTAAVNGPEKSTEAESIQAQLSIVMVVNEITAEGTVKMAALEDWKRANQIAWDMRAAIGLQ
jgi:hypothetical protein